MILAVGHPVTSDRLIDGIWGQGAPDRAGASLRACISGLRRILEPALACEMYRATMKSDDPAIGGDRIPGVGVGEWDRTDALPQAVL